jgi:hypothetical protein
MRLEEAVKSFQLPVGLCFRRPLPIIAFRLRLLLLEASGATAVSKRLESVTESSVLVIMRRDFLLAFKMTFINTGKDQLQVGQTPGFPTLLIRDSR